MLNMKKLLIVSLFFGFVLFISGCEGGVQMAPSNYNLVELPDDPEAGGLYGGGGQYGNRNLLTGICTNLQGNCGDSSGSNSVEAYCSDNPYLDCAEGDLCYVNPESPVCGVSHAGLGDCYCLGDGICHDNFGEPIASPDCETCINGETQSCNLPYVPGTCGECNVGLKTCINNQWGICEQIVDPVEEICDNGQDDDCDCTADENELACLEPCGDDIIQTPNDDGLNEICDGIDLGGEDCTTQGFDFGTLDCLTDCTGFDTDGCYNEDEQICGDDIIQTPNDAGLNETCDGLDLDGENCTTQGFDGGVLGCLSDCNGFDVGGCIIEEDCNITYAKWDGFATEESRMVNVNTKITVGGMGGCVGKSASIQVLEVDANGELNSVVNDPIDIVFSDHPPFSGQWGETNWTTEWQYDGGTDPEYIIRAELVEDETVIFVGHELLHVSQDLPSCEGGDIVHQCINDQDGDVTVSWFATGDQACNYVFGTECITVQQNPAYLGGDYLNNEPVYGWGYNSSCETYLDNWIAAFPEVTIWRAKCGEFSECDGVCDIEDSELYCRDPDCSGVAGVTQSCANDNVTCSATTYPENEIYAGGGNPQNLRHPTATNSCGQKRMYFANQGCVDSNTVRMMDASTFAIKEFECMPGRYCTNAAHEVWSCVDPDDRETLCIEKGFGWDGTDCYGDDCDEINSETVGRETKPFNFINWIMNLFN